MLCIKINSWLLANPSIHRSNNHFGTPPFEINSGFTFSFVFVWTYSRTDNSKLWNKSVCVFFFFIKSLNQQQRICQQQQYKKWQWCPPCFWCDGWMDLAVRDGWVEGGRDGGRGEGNGKVKVMKVRSNEGVFGNKKAPVSKIILNASTYAYWMRWNLSNQSQQVFRGGIGAQRANSYIGRKNLFQEERSNKRTNGQSTVRWLFHTATPGR